jgi:eukaryotic-like serine/threonine-protein kinase
MTPERWQQIRHVLEKALELVPDQRRAYLDRACTSDSSLRREVETLLASSDDVRSNFLQSAPPQVALTAGTTLGDYEVKSMLGSGGMGEVYRARDPRLGRDVAIKVLPPLFSADPERLRRFEQEARAAAALNHPNILAVFQMGTYEGAPYLVSEMLEGDTLRQVVKRGRLTVRKVVDYAVQIAHGLAAAHEKGIVHRDLKPENLFVTKDGRVKILDFGLAKLTQPLHNSEHSAPTLTEGTEAGVVMGTVGYMSPEQVRGQKADHRTDIFSFGAILYEMLSGKRAFQKSTSADTMSAILNEDPPAISELNTNIPPGLQRVVHRCLEKNAEQRFQSASDLAFALDAASEGSGHISTSNHFGKVRSPVLGGRLKWLAVIGLILPCITAAVTETWKFWKREISARTQVVQRQLTARTFENPLDRAVISRDGQYLALEDKDGISIQEIENGDVHKLSGTRGVHLWDWYPDGLHLLVTEAQDLFALFAFSGEKHVLASKVASAAISPDGSQIMLLRDSPVSELWTMPTVGGKQQLRLSLGPGEVLGTFTWSPDGNSVAYLRVPRTKGPAVTLEARNLGDGSSRTILSDQGLRTGVGDYILKWLADGRILFTLFKRGTNSSESELWAISLDSSGSPVGKPGRLTSTPGLGIGDATAGADGRRLAVRWYRLSYSIFVAGLRGEKGQLDKPVRLTDDSWNNFPGSWTPDGQTLFYQSTRSDQFLYKRRMSSDSAELFASGPAQWFGTTVTPDGAWVMATAHVGDPPTNQLFRIPVKGGTPENILTSAPGSMAETRCAFSGSRICILSENIGKQMVLTAIDPVNGRLEQLARLEMPKGDLNWSFDPEGGRIAFLDYPDDKLRVLDLKSGQIRVIRPVPPENGMNTLAWSSDGRGVFVTACPDRCKLLEVDANSGKVQTLLENLNDMVTLPLPSPDGKRLAYCQVVKESNVTLLENF